jgi:hypothetical protein
VARRTFLRGMMLLRSILPSLGQPMSSQLSMRAPVVARGFALLWAGLLAGALLIGGGSALISQRRSGSQQRSQKQGRKSHHRRSIAGAAPAAEPQTARRRSIAPFRPSGTRTTSQSIVGTA